MKRINDWKNIRKIPDYTLLVIEDNTLNQRKIFPLLIPEKESRLHSIKYPV